MLKIPEPVDFVPAELQPAGIETFVDLFCGIGGFHYAAQSLGLKCVFASDIDADACNQYERNFGIRPKGDITRIKAVEIPDHHLLFAGFPCQPFSIIGNRLGVADDRGRLVNEVVRILKKKKPRAFVLENVKQFSTDAKGKTIEKVLKNLSAAGYGVKWKILNALDYGLPQKRERCIIVGFRESGMDSFEWPAKMERYKPLAEILESNPEPQHFVSEHIRKNRRSSHETSLKPAIWHENKGGNIASHPFSCALRAGASYNYLLVDGERRLTPREQLRLQGFPECFEVVGNYSQIRKQTGNAVPVPMVRAVIREVLHAIDQDQRQETPKARAVSA